jgi:four helix bundle protein
MSSPTFERLRVWHEARRLTTRIYLITRNGPFSSDFGFRDQIRRAAVSVMSNIAEGYERGGRKEFLRFLAIAKASAAEVRSQLYAAEDIGYLDAASAGDLRQQAASLCRQIAALSRRLEANDDLRGG